LVRRHTDTALLRQFLELQRHLGGRGLKLLLLPHLRALGEDEMCASSAAIAERTVLDANASDISNADETIRLDPHGGDASGAEIIFCEFAVSIESAHACEMADPFDGASSATASASNLNFPFRLSLTFYGVR